MQKTPHLIRRICTITVLYFLVLTSTNIYSQIDTALFGKNDLVGKYYSIRGIKMYVEVYGTGKPLLLIHGNGGSIKSFKSNISFFAQRYQVIALDSRAQGRSMDKADSLSFEMMADDEAALLDELHIDSCLVLGWSDGGINALLLAIRHPKKVLKLAATGANLWPDSTGINPGYWRKEKKEFDTTNPALFTTEKQKAHWKLFLLDWLQPNIPLSSLKAIHCPALIIGGDHDLIPVEHTVQIYKNIPNAYLWILPNSGHGTLKEHTEDFNKLVDNFFTKPFKKR